jgi:hypothetical protein
LWITRARDVDPSRISVADWPPSVGLSHRSGGEPSNEKGRQRKGRVSGRAAGKVDPAAIARKPARQGGLRVLPVRRKQLAGRRWARQAIWARRSARITILLI